MSINEKALREHLKAKGFSDEAVNDIINRSSEPKEPKPKKKMFGGGGVRGHGPAQQKTVDLGEL